ncbi:MAG: hypothetical protein KDA93_01810 [Planctomycetaceae bacterium]|nr:hypothetical protein [Planctomycetaceae bacterium]
MWRDLGDLLVIGLDVIVAVCLVVFGFIGAGWCDQHLTPYLDLYLFWCSVGMVPFLLYGKWRGVMQGRISETLVFMAVFTVLLSLLHLILSPDSLLWLIASCILATTAASWLTRRFFGVDRHSDVRVDEQSS